MEFLFFTIIISIFFSLLFILKNNEEVSYVDNNYTSYFEDEDYYNSENSDTNVEDYDSSGSDYEEEDYFTDPTYCYLEYNIFHSLCYDDSNDDDSLSDDNDYYNNWTSYDDDYSFYDDDDWYTNDDYW